MSRVERSVSPIVSFASANTFLFVVGVLLFAVGLLTTAPGRALAGPPINDPANHGGGSMMSVSANNGATLPGYPRPWVGRGSANLGTGNKLTTLPLVSWKARGGMSVGFALYHNSQGDLQEPLAACWRFSYDSYIVFSGTAGSSNATIHWEDGSGVTFNYSGGNYSAPTGEHGTFLKIGSNPDVYQYNTPDQIHYTFIQYGTTDTRYFLCSIADRNSNFISVYRSASAPWEIASVVDPSNRTLIFDWVNDHLHSITDPFNRTWILNYSGIVGFDLVQDTTDGPGGDWYYLYNNFLLQSVTFPGLANDSTTYQVSFAYTQLQHITERPIPTTPARFPRPRIAMATRQSSIT